MSCSDSGTVVQMGKLVVHMAENGHSYKLECDRYTLVEAVQKFLESACGVAFSDQLLLCFDSKMEAQRPLSAYKLPSDEREVFLFNRARMRSNSPHPAAEQLEIINIADPQLPSPSNDPHPLDDASDPALKALPSYERQFRYHFQFGYAIYSRTLAKFEACERLLQELKVQERALEIAKGNLDHFYKMIHQNYTDFMKCYSHMYRCHTNLLANFGRDKEKLSYIKILPPLQSAHCKCLLDFVKDENLQKSWEECTSLHRQFENKVSEFKLEFGELKSNAEHLFSDKASFLVKDLELSIKDHQHLINKQKNIMRALSKDVDTVKKLVNDCLSCPLSSPLRPHDAVSALGPMYDSHEKTYLPNMQSCECEISSLLDVCRDKKNEMNTFVHIFMQKVAHIQSTIKEVRYKFSVFQDALKRQNDQFEQLKVVRQIGLSYRACLAEVVRRKAVKKIYMGKAGQLAEKLATERDAEVRRREEFLKVHSAYIPRDILASMGLYDMPNPCNVYVAPFDCNLLDIGFSELERYAPESILGLSKREKHGTLRSSLSMSEVEGEVEFVEISGARSIEVENAKLKAELASKIALICSMSADFDYELDDTELNILRKNAADKTTEALHLKDEYEKHLQSILKVKQMQCESYEKRIHELEQKLSDHYMRVCQLSGDENVPNFTVSTAKTDDNKSDVSGVGEVHMQHTMEETFCASSSLKSGSRAEQDKAQEGLDDNMTDSSSILNSQLDSSMLDLHLDKGHHCDKDKKTTPSPDSDRLVLELQNALTEKSGQLDNAETKIQELSDEVSKLGSELGVNRKLLDESQMNCAHLENCLHEAREEAQKHLCAAERRVSESNTLRVPAINMRGLFERLRSCVSSVGVAAFSDSLCAFSQSLASSSNESDDESTAEFRDCIQILADKVGLLSRQHTELLERCSKGEAANEQLNQELEEKKELVNTLYVKHHQANKEKISLNQFAVNEIAAFILNSSGHYEAINLKSPHYYLSAECVALFSEYNPTYIIGQVVHIEREVVKPASDEAEEDRGPASKASNPYSLPVGCEYFVVSIAMLVDSGGPS